MSQVISPYDLSAASQIPALTNQFAPNQDSRGTAWSTTGWGNPKYDATLKIISGSSSLLICPYDLSSASQIPALTNQFPPNKDARGTSWSTTGWGALKYDATLKITFTAAAVGILGFMTTNSRYWGT